MSQSTAELLRQGLAITAVGMGLVFGALALFWGAISLLGRIPSPGSAPAVEPGPVPALVSTPPVEPPTAAAPEADGRAALTEERAHVAAVVAGALMANALMAHAISPSSEPSPGPTFEHGRTAPAWVTTNRARIMRPWQPPRFTEK
jgi:Na+-transporting methylmalonyl-CoA/oxaloacetate decarboxylase gamma subunit